MRLTSAFFACVLLALTGATAAATRPAPLPGDSIYQLPMVLTDQHGKRWDWGSKRGQPQVVAMFYTSCQFTCPLIVDSGKAIEHALGPAERQRLGLMLISIDPKRDTPAALMRVAKERGLDGAHWSLASPDAPSVRAAAGVLGVRYRQLANGDFNHTSGLLLLDRDGRIVARTEHVGSVADPAFVKAVRAALVP
jgi:protein SCO1/2